MTSCNKLKKISIKRRSPPYNASSCKNEKKEGKYQILYTSRSTKKKSKNGKTIYRWQYDGFIPLSVLHRINNSFNENKVKEGKAKKLVVYISSTNLSQLNKEELVKLIRKLNDKIQDLNPKFIRYKRLNELSRNKLFGVVRKIKTYNDFLVRSRRKSTNKKKKSK